MSFEAYMRHKITRTSIAPAVFSPMIDVEGATILAVGNMV